MSVNPVTWRCDVCFQNWSANKHRKFFLTLLENTCLPRILGVSSRDAQCAKASSSRCCINCHTTDSMVFSLHLEACHSACLYIWIRADLNFTSSNSRSDFEIAARKLSVSIYGKMKLLGIPPEVYWEIPTDLSGLRLDSVMIGYFCLDFYFYFATIGSGRVS